MTIILFETTEPTKRVTSLIKYILIMPTVRFEFNILGRLTIPETIRKNLRSIN